MQTWRYFKFFLDTACFAARPWILACGNVKLDSSDETTVASRSNFLGRPRTSMSGRLLSSGSWILNRLVGSTLAYKPLLLQKTAITCLIASCMVYISLPFLQTLKWSPLLSISVCLLEEHFKFGISVISERNRIFKIVLNSRGVSLRAGDFGVESRALLPSEVAELKKAASVYFSFFIVSMNTISENEL